MANLHSLISRLFDNESPAVHFHSGPQGQPTVCHDEHCSSPRLDPNAI